MTTRRRGGARPCCLLAVLGALCLTLPATAEGAIFYVDPASKGGRCKDTHRVGQAIRRSTPWCSLRTAFNRAPAGSSLRLRSGVHRSVTPAQVSRRPARLTLSSHRGERAVLAGVFLKRCRGLAFKGLTLRYVRIEACSGTSFTDNDVNVGGLWAFFSNDLRFERNRLHDTDNGLVLKRVKRVRVEGNDFRRIPRPQIRGPGGDGIQAGNVEDLTIRANVFDEFLIHAHPDSIEFEGSNLRVTLDGNAFHHARGPISVSGPALDADARAGRRVTWANRNWRIVNNEFTIMREWAAELINVPGAQIVNNTVWFSRNGIRLHGDTTGVVVANNILDFVSADRADMVSRSTNNVIGRAVGAYPVSATDLRGEPTFVDPTEPGNYDVLGASFGIDAALPALATARDRLGRPRVGPPDVGAYEYQGG